MEVYIIPLSYADDETQMIQTQRDEETFHDRPQLQ